CVYTYHAARLAPALAVVFIAAAWWDERRRARAAADAVPPPRRVLAVALLTITLTLALVPAVSGWMRDPGALTGRVNATSVWVEIAAQRSWAPLWEAAWRTLGMFHYQQGP